MAVSDFADMNGEPFAVKGRCCLLSSIAIRCGIRGTPFCPTRRVRFFDEYGDIDLGELNSSVAAGLSMRTARAFLMSVRIAHSEDENALIGFAMEQEF